MPLTESGLEVIPSTVRIAEIQAAIDTNLGQSLSYDGTPEGAITETVGTAQFDVESGQAIILDALDPDTSVGAILDRHARRLGLTRRPATFSRWTVQASATTTITYPAGYFLDALDPNGVLRRWVVVADTTIILSPSTTPLVIESVESGPISIETTQTLTVVTALAGLVEVTYNSASTAAVQLGRVRESDTRLRVRIRRLRAALAGPTDPGLRRALLALSWVEAISLSRTGPAQPAIVVVPQPIGADQILELATTIDASIAYGMVTQGTESYALPLPDGSTETIRWGEGTDLPVTIVTEVVLLDVALADVIDAIRESIAGEFAKLDVGATLRYAFVYRSITQVAGVVGITSLTLGGGTADIAPLSTELVVPDGDPTVTV